jgi:hypothetical protein
VGGANQAGIHLGDVLLFYGSTPACPIIQPGSMSIVQCGSAPGRPAACSVEIRQLHACSRSMDGEPGRVLGHHAIEHLLDPRGTLIEVARVLRPGAMVALTTGNIRSVRSRLRGRDWALVRPPKHLYYFSPETLSQLLESVGLRVVDRW